VTTVAWSDLEADAGEEGADGVRVVGGLDMGQVLRDPAGLRRREVAGGDEVILGGKGRGGCRGGAVEEALEGGEEMHGVKAGEGIPYRREHPAGGGGGMAHLFFSWKALFPSDTISRQIAGD
jgi:hypothetical protein